MEDCEGCLGCFIGIVIAPGPNAREAKKQREKGQFELWKTNMSVSVTGVGIGIGSGVELRAESEPDNRNRNPNPNPKGPTPRVSAERAKAKRMKWKAILSALPLEHRRTARKTRREEPVAERRM
jgi:hypothetical protein